MPVKFIYRPQGLHEPFGYSHVALVGSTAFLAGQVGISPDGEIEKGFEEQARRAFMNVGTILSELGASLGDIAKLQVMLTDVGDLPTYKKVRDSILPHRPASTLTVVKSLASPDFLCEIEAIAMVNLEAPE